MFDELSDEEWYQRYDDRTNKYLKAPSARNKKILIVSTDSSTYEGQLMTILSVNLISRFCNKLTVVCDDARMHDLLFSYDRLNIINELQQTAFAADCRGQFTIIQLQDVDPGSFDYILKIGSGVCPLTTDFTIEGAGWQVYLGQGNCEFGSIAKNVINPTGPGAAACLGAADCFKTINGIENREKAVSFSMFDYRPGINNPITPQNIDLGSVFIIGLGMIGSSIAYFLKKFHSLMELHLLDHDDVKIENLSRSPLFKCTDIGNPKVKVVGDYLEVLEDRCHPITFSQFILEKGSLSNVDIVIPVANEYGARRQIQQSYPPFMLYASTDRIWGVELGRFIPGQTDCIECRYPDSKSEFKTSCGKGDVFTPAEIQEDLALPFLAPIAGLMVVGELMKLGLEGYPFIENRILLNTLGSVSHICMINRKDCGCYEIEAHKELNSKTKFFHLFS
jgi:molybdopterin/thiamine biosynthesis adenylyltransferase